MALLDLTIVNIAIPNMITNLSASLDDVLWVINAYALVLAVLVITAGRLGDLVGARIMFITRIAVVAAAARGGVGRRGRGGGRGHDRRAHPGGAAGDGVRLAVDFLREPADRRTGTADHSRGHPGPAAPPP